MKIIFLGSTKYSEELLNFLLRNNINIISVYGIPENFNISYSEIKVRNYNYADLSIIAKNNNIYYYEVDSTNGKKIMDYYEIIKKIQPDVILALGWYYMIPRKIREIAKYGAWGIHASLLPKYAGGAPLVWAMINGEKESGVTLFRFDDGVDDGDIIMQKPFFIDSEDSIKDVYQKAINASKEILLSALNNINSIHYTPQDKNRIQIWPQRKPEDGEIDLNKPANELYNFIRAQSSPYPGAFIRTPDNKKLIIEKARIEEF